MNHWHNEGLEILKNKNEKKKDIRTLNWYQRFWYSIQNKTIKKAQSDKS